MKHKTGRPRFKRQDTALLDGTSVRVTRVFWDRLYGWSYRVIHPTKGPTNVAEYDLLEVL